MTRPGAPMSDLISDPPTHELKVWPPYFDALISGVKTFEFRRDDREPRYAVGDVLWLREWGPDGGDIGSYSGSGRECYRRVTYVARDGVIPAGFCVMSIEPVPPSSSAEPAPPMSDERKLGLIEFALKAHRFVEAEDFDDGNAAGEIAAHCSCGFICSPEGNEWVKDHRIAWERHVAAAILAAKPSYSVVMAAENSSLSPVQEEATPTPKPLSRTAMAIAALVGGAGEQGIPKERLAPMLYMADVLAREYLGHPITDIEWTAEAVAALPTKVSFVELAKLLGVEAFFSDSEDGRTSVPSDGINRLRDTLSELQDVLSGSISERETLTAERRRFGQFAARAERIYSAHVPRLGIVADRLFDADDRAAIAVVVGFLSDIASEPKLLERGMTEYDRQLEKSQAAVARLTTERDKFRDWFQNAEQARAVAIAERDSAQADLDVSLNLLERQEASLAHRATCIAQLETQLEAAKQFGEAPTNG